MVDTIELDYEGANEIDLTKVGVDVYTAHPSARPLMLAYSINRTPIKQWFPRSRVPAEVKDALEDPTVEKWAFNAAFERLYTRRVMKIKTPYKGWRCTMVLAYLMGFPGGLDLVGERVGMSQDKRKAKDGKRLIQMFCQPQKITKTQPHLWRDETTDPDDWQKFCEYNVQDVEAERALRERLIGFPVPPEEWETYELDQLINDRGLPIDMQFVENAIWMSDKRKAELTDQMRQVTDLANPGSVAQLRPWLSERGYMFGDLQKESVQKALTIHKDVDGSVMAPDCVEALKLRQWQARSSVSKFKAMRDTSTRSRHGWRARHTYQMAGATRTTRWAGRRVQTQNMVTTPDYFQSEEGQQTLAVVNHIIKDGDYESLNLFTAEPMDVLSKITRSAIAADPDCVLKVCDLASIESAMIGWITKCERLLGVFANKMDPYKDFATDFYKVAYESVTRQQRKFCKPPVLGCGFRLGGGEVRDGKRTGLWGYAENMGVDIPQKEAHRAVSTFRSIYPEIPAHWKLLEDAIERTLKRHVDTWVGPIRFEYRKPFLLMWLPGGRKPLYYFKPLLKTVTINTGRKVQRRSRGMFEDGAERGAMIEVDETYDKLSFSYMGKQQNGSAWVRIFSHGGKVIENAVQGGAREVFAKVLRRLGRDHFPIVGHSHDEAIIMTRKDDNYFTFERMKSHFVKPMMGYPGLPLGAAGFESPFYLKD